VRKRRFRVVASRARELPNGKLALTTLPVFHATIERVVAPESKTTTRDEQPNPDPDHDDPGDQQRGEPPWLRARRRHGFRPAQRRHAQPTRGHRLARRWGLVTVGRRRRHQGRLELQKPFARRVDVVVRRLIRRILRALARRVELGERVGLIEGDELALARLPDQCLSRQRRPAKERTKRCLDGGPRFDQISCELLGIPRAVEPSDRGSGGIERSLRVATFHGGRSYLPTAEGRRRKPSAFRLLVSERFSAIQRARSRE
jgi:hypothetical protein